MLRQVTFKQKIKVTRTFSRIMTIIVIKTKKSKSSKTQLLSHANLKETKMFQVTILKIHTLIKLQTNILRPIPFLIKRVDKRLRLMSMIC